MEFKICLWFKSDVFLAGEVARALSLIAPLLPVCYQNTRYSQLSAATMHAQRSAPPQTFVVALTGLCLPSVGRPKKVSAAEELRAR